MVFSTIIFLLRFLPITLALYYLAPPKLKNTVLFLCSLVFYCWGEVRFFPVMLALILINYLCGLGLERFGQNKTARLILLLIALAAVSGCSSTSSMQISCSAASMPSSAPVLRPSGIQRTAAGHQLLHLPDTFLHHRRLPPGCENGA